MPGFREFAVFEKSKRFFYIFFGWVLHRGGQGPGKGPNIPYHIEWLYIQSWQKNRKNQKKSKKLKKIKNHRNNFWGPCQVLNIPYHIEWLYIQSWQKKSKKSKKNRKNKKKIEKNKKCSEQFLGPLPGP